MPPPPTKRRQIIDRIVELLDNITLANDFFTDLGSTAVNPGVISINQNAIPNFSRNKGPFVTVVFNNMTWTPETSNPSEVITELIAIDLYVNPKNSSLDPYEVMDELLADIEYALFNAGSPTGTPTKFNQVSLNGLAFVTATEKLSFFNDQGELLIDEGTAWGRLTIQITYETEVTTP